VSCRCISMSLSPQGTLEEFIRGPYAPRPKFDWRKAIAIALAAVVIMVLLAIVSTAGALEVGFWIALWVAGGFRPSGKGTPTAAQ